MERRFVMIVALFILAALGYAQEMQNTASPEGTSTGKAETLTGYVVDAMCAKGIVKKGGKVMERAAAHTKECALEKDCAASGYGVFSDGKYIKFDKHGDEMAQNLVQKTDKEKAIAVEVTGKMEGNRFAVASMKETTLGKTQGGEGDKADVKEGAVEDQQR
jgi:hypothetical protein